MNPSRPVFRKLRVFALDPSTAVQLDSAGINEMVVSVPWEDLKPGPSGEYIKVVDENEQGNTVVSPGVDLNDAAILAQAGLEPSDGDPHFHQQMVYAVTMQTIGLFERALGRYIHWEQGDDGYVPQLNIYPHYYNDTAKSAYLPGKGITFGFFEADVEGAARGMDVFTCLSQDVIAREASHALLAPILPHGDAGDQLAIEAFRKGFCDLVAVLQRCTQPEFVRHQLAMTRGDLDGPSQLAIFARQYGDALGSKSGLRSAFGEYDDDGIWRAHEPDPTSYRTHRIQSDPQRLADVLFRAVFHGLNRIYRVRVADLLRIATEGTGILPNGMLHPDLVKRLADEAVMSAQHVLNMCIRALDYMPALAPSFGDYLRAIITADYDLVPTDSLKYRLAFVEAFRSFGILPTNVGTLAPDTLRWPSPDANAANVVERFVHEVCDKRTAWRLPRIRKAQYALMDEWRTILQQYFDEGKLNAQHLPGSGAGMPVVVKSIRPSERVVPPDPAISLWVIEIEQTAASWLTNWKLLVDADTGLVKYVVGKTVGPGAHDSATVQRSISLTSVPAPKPTERRLRVFAFDPSLETQLDTARISQVTLRVPWEKLTPGPVGEYLEVVDYDPASNCYYEPANLDYQYVLAESGYTPSQAVPQFHQQMVYAVAMRTIRNFENALGRLALWSPHRERSSKEGGEEGYKDVFVQKLRLYPHALREANAFYSPDKKAVLFGYFQSIAESEVNPVTIFTCLSHDIIAHELTHALLDGMHRRFAEPSNPDVLAFHEAFADIVALFQHFSFPEVLEHQIAKTRGDLASQNQLGELAQEFGSAIGNRGSLRSAIGEYDKTTGQWHALQPDPEAYERVMEPHARGSLLVAAVFDAFLTIYRARAADLLRIATRGTGVLPAGQLHPDLIRRLATEAAASAQEVLDMCIRALDYCPPVDITFGDYLRAIVTADREFDPIDERRRRIAFVEAFRRHGILPEGVRTFALEGLYWPPDEPLPDQALQEVQKYIDQWTSNIESWNLTEDREQLYNLMDSMREKLHWFLNEPAIRPTLDFIDPDLPFEVHALRPSTRIDLLGKRHFQWIFEVTQWLPDFYDIAQACAFDESMRTASASTKTKLRDEAGGDYRFRGGSTVIVDVETGGVLFGIRKPIGDQRRRKRQRDYRSGLASQSMRAIYFRNGDNREPFAALHRF